jgi:hypothetical protein
VEIVGAGFVVRRWSLVVGEIKIARRPKSSSLVFGVCRQDKFTDSRAMLPLMQGPWYTFEPQPQQSKPKPRFPNEGGPQTVSIAEAKDAALPLGKVSDLWQ